MESKYGQKIFQEHKTPLSDVDFDTSDETLVKTLCNETNYIGKKLTTNTKVPGGIKNPDFFNFWKNDLKAGNFQLSVISEGYKIPFDAFPPESCEKINKSALREPLFAKAELDRLESLGCIYKVKEKPQVVNPLSVVMSKKFRLVVDAPRALNSFI